jgi:hypothetical protein
MNERDAFIAAREIKWEVTWESPVICHKGRWVHVILFTDGSAIVEYPE